MYSEAADFEEKQAAYADMASCAERFTGRDWRDIANGALALELGGSGGLLGGIVSASAGRVICTDIIDTQVQYGGEFSRLLKEKFQRNGRDLDLGRLEFQVADAQYLPYRDAHFDLVFSQNALEHIPDPLAAIGEALRVLKPGGFLYASFDPVWTADSGSHFFDLIGEPWLHLLESDEAICNRMTANGASEWQLSSYRTDMNRLPAAFYRDRLPPVLGASASSSQIQEWRGCVRAEFASHENRTRAADRLGCDPDDLLIRGFRILAVK
jgi:SAM-dependent methyltransferase